jgi:Cu/Ag efflux protein CusF
MTTKRSNVISMLTIAATLLVAGCGGSESTDAPASGAAGGAMPGMPNMPQAAQAPQHLAQGTVNSVDQAAGTVNISHGAVASANWPAMAMSFKLANPAAAADIGPGQRVEFRFTIAGGMDATVTEIKRLE